MERYIHLVFGLFFLSPVCCLSQTVDIFGKDSVSVPEAFLIQEDTVFIGSQVQGKGEMMTEKFVPDSKKATLYATFFPGLGQIYNRKYWKLPLVYGSFVGCMYAINWNGSQYNGYRKAYIDFVDDDPATNSWNDYRFGAYLREDFGNWTTDMKQSFANNLKMIRDYHRRNRDLSYIVTIGVYAIWIVDAYVDAQLFSFDISPDLSMRVEPVLFDSKPGKTRSIGMQLSFAF